MMGLGGCAWLPTFTTAIPASENTACGVSQDRVEGERWFYPPGQREACLRVLKALADLKAQRTRGELGELVFLERAVMLLNGPDATAVLAGSTAPNGGWLGERKHAYEQTLETAQRSASVVTAARRPRARPLCCGVVADPTRERKIDRPRVAGAPETDGRETSPLPP